MGKFDTVVSACWADEVAAGRASEGDLLPTLDGGTVRIYSSIANAVATNSGALYVYADITDMGPLYVRAGKYTERRWWQFWRR